MIDDGKATLALGIVQGILGFWCSTEGYAGISLMLGIWCGAFVVAGLNEMEQYKKSQE